MGLSWHLHAGPRRLDLAPLFSIRARPSGGGTTCSRLAGCSDHPVRDLVEEKQRLTADLRSFLHADKARRDVLRGEVPQGLRDFERELESRMDGAEIEVQLDPAELTSRIDRAMARALRSSAPMTASQILEQLVGEKQRRAARGESVPEDPLQREWEDRRAVAMGPFPILGPSPAMRFTRGTAMERNEVFPSSPPMPFAMPHPSWAHALIVVRQDALGHILSVRIAGTGIAAADRGIEKLVRKSIEEIGARNLGERITSTWKFVGGFDPGERGYGADGGRTTTLRIQGSVLLVALERG